MKIHIKYAEQIVGLFIVLSIIGLALVLVLLGLNQRWFKGDVKFYTIVKDAGDLRQGSPIKYKNFDIGRVEDKNLDGETRMVQINFNIFEEYHYLVVKNSVVEVLNSPIGLGSTMLFHPGRVESSSLVPLEGGTEIPSYDQEAGLNLVRKGLVDRQTGENILNSLANNLGPVIDKLEPTIFTIQQLALALEEGIKGKQENNQIGQALYKINRILAAFQGTGGQSPLEEIMQNLREASVSFEQFASEIEDPTGLATTLLDPHGSIATLLDDNNDLYRKLYNIMDNIEKVTASIEDVAAFLSRSTPQISSLIEEGNTTMVELQDVLEALKNNPLLKGGITESIDQPNTYRSLRDTNF